MPGQLPAEGVVLIGVDLELQRRMAERAGLPAPDAPALPASNSGAPNSTATDLSAPQAEAPKLDAPTSVVDLASESPAQNTSAPELPAPELNAAPATGFSEPAPAATLPNSVAEDGNSAPDFGALDIDIEDFLVRRSGTKTYAVHSISRIEDVVTAAERELLRWLWERGRPLPFTQKLRLTSGPNGEGARRLAAQAGLIYNTFKNLTRSLSAKLALDIVKPERNLPAIYVIYHYSAILERQRQAGYTGAIHKNGGGRELVNSSGQTAPKRPDLTVKQLEQILAAHKFGAPNQNPGAPNYSAPAPASGAPKFPPLIRKKEYTPEKEHTATAADAANFGAPPAIVKALFDRTGRSDSAAARVIAKGCLEANSTVTPEEIARLIRAAHLPPSITNPVGLLIRTLPNHCAPDSIAHYRERWAEEARHAATLHEQERAQDIRTAKSILEGVAAGEEWDANSIGWAKFVLTEDPESAAG